MAQNGKLVVILEDQSEYSGKRTIREDEFVSQVKSVALEQAGPIRAVVKIQGMHQSSASGRVWLPFTIRMYFHAGQESLRMVHTFVFDGDEHKDFIRGLAVVFSVPLHEQIQNRHVRFSGAGNGLWAEPVQPLKGRDGRFAADANGRVVYPDQIAGKRVPDKENVNARGRNLLSSWAVWDSFKLVQPNVDGFSIVKRTNPDSCWLPAGAGKRSSGLAFIGDADYRGSEKISGTGARRAGLACFCQQLDDGVGTNRKYEIPGQNSCRHGKPREPAVRIPLGKGTAFRLRSRRWQAI